MAFYVYRPSACPACDTRDLIERNYTPAPGMHLVSYHCPRCQWMVEGRDPASMSLPELGEEVVRTTSQSLKSLARYDMGEAKWFEIDEPMRRHSNPPLTHEMLASRTGNDHLSPYPDHLTAHLPAELPLEERQGQGQDNIAFAKESNVLGLFIDETDERE